MMKRYLLSKGISIGFFVITLIFCIIFLLLITIPYALILLMACTISLLFIAWLFVSYQIEHRKLRRMEQLIEQLEQPYLVGEILLEPTSLIEQKYFEMMRVISHDAISQVEATSRQSVDYKEYVEQWIHELKTPLTAMSLILANEPDVRKLRRELKRADNLTDTILHYARLQTLEKDKQFSSFPMAQIVNAAVKNQMDVLIAAKIQVEIIGDFQIYNDQKALQFIINQLLINSAKYCPACKITIHMQHHQLVYTDNGIGIPKHELSRIFERGYTGSNGRTLGTSTGMGLYIVAKLCDELHISYTAHSEVNQFTRFTFIFPNLTKM